MDAKELKKRAGRKALEYVKSGMKIGLGTGSTVNEFIKLLSYEIKNGLEIQATATSIQTEKLCAELSIKLYDLDELVNLDLVVDGADEITENLGAIKGGGGALLREKIVAYASEAMLVIADESKLVDKLGTFPLPIEINKFGMETTKKACLDLLYDLGYENIQHKWRKSADGNFFETDGGHVILDVLLGEVDEFSDIGERLLNIPGVVEHGLFLDLPTSAIIAMNDGEFRII